MEKNRLVFSVSELNRHIKATLEPAYADIWVEGEISNLRIPQSGHCYMTLKDGGGQIRAVMFKGQQRMLRFVPEDGLKVICRGRISVYEPRGEYQIILASMEPRGVGELQLAFEQLKKKLGDEGLFDERRKKPLPFLPAKIAVITSPTGAAVRDIIKVLHRRFPGCGITVVPVKVQGDEAPDEITTALAVANEHNLGEVIILGRGGGSIEDLWAFNDEKVARAVFASDIPVVSAVGHEIDFTITDFVADLRAPTPSAAAEIVVKEKKELKKQTRQLDSRLKVLLSQSLERSRMQVKHLAASLQSPVRKLNDYQLRYDDLHAELLQNIAAGIRQRRERVETAQKIVLAHSPQQAVAVAGEKLHLLTKALKKGLYANLTSKAALLKTLAGRLNALSPLQVLERGYSITRQVPSREVVKDAAQLRQGSAVCITFHKGDALCRVENITTREH